MNRFFVWILVLSLVMMMSCNKEVFDEEKYNEIVNKAQPVDSIDNTHTWVLTNTYEMTVDIPDTALNVSRLQILSGNPVSGQGVVILGDYITKNGHKQNVSFITPNTLTTLYAALVDEDDTYTIIQFDPATQRYIDFSKPVASNVKLGSHLGNQSFSYCFENEMPEPGDYDYNDIVLRVSQERTAENQITLNVTLAAVGSQTQMAAAIRLLNYTFDDIESVTTTDGEMFDDGYDKSPMPFIEGKDLLIKNENNEAIINLFEDAHWATGVAQYDNIGYLYRYKYNVSKITSKDYDMMSPRTISYVITFKSHINLDHFTMEQLDPFVIVGYNSTLLEVHAVYKYRSATVLHNYKLPTSAIMLPWGLTIPIGSFRYPLDGVHIGFAKNGALFGAYMFEGHSFGEWVADHTKAIDWYNYPTGNMVY